MTPLFGILQLDRGEPLGFGNALGLVQAWLQDAGGFAFAGLVLYFLYVYFGRRAGAVLAAGLAAGPVVGAVVAGAVGPDPNRASESNRLRMPVTTWMVAMFGLALVSYTPVLALVGLEWWTERPREFLFGMPVDPPPLPPPSPGSPVKVEPPVWHWELRPALLILGGLFAVLGIGHPFARDLLKVKGRRVWALAKLGFKEALRSRLYWVFLIVLLPFLFRNVWSAGSRPVDEFRNLVGVTTLVETVLVLAVAAILAAFSLPTDIKNQTIHTVVTKPVERFEVILGRFLGYTALMTLALAGMTAASLVFINAANIDEKALQETATARMPVRGALGFQSRRAEFEGTNVGREFEYRKYISGHPDSPQRGVWRFADVPPPAGRDFVPVEFTFDIYKLTKGEENKGAAVTLRFVTHNCPQQVPRPDQKGEWPWADPAREREYRAEVDAYRARGVNPEAATPADKAGWEAAGALAEKYGFYEVRGKEVLDYTVMGVDVPAGLFKNARQGDPPAAERDGKKAPGPRVLVYVKCESPGQMLGMAEPDLYFLEGAQPFGLNLVKWAVGLWCKLCIVVGVAVACSTYLSGVLSLLMTLLVYVLGNVTDHLNDLALNRSVGGGPFESLSRLVRTETPTAPAAETGGAKVLQAFDRTWAWVVRRIQNVVPDVESFTWTNFVSEGFNVSGEYLAVNLLVTAGYLIPWFVLAYYLFKAREVAS